jgi:hypothetical protein
LREGVLRSFFFHAPFDLDRTFEEGAVFIKICGVVRVSLNRTALLDLDPVRNASRSQLTGAGRATRIFGK